LALFSVLVGAFSPNDFVTVFRSDVKPPEPCDARLGLPARLFCAKLPEKVGLGSVVEIELLGSWQALYKNIITDRTQAMKHVFDYTPFCPLYQLAGASLAEHEWPSAS
jgi:hypothetical protein